MPDTPPPEREFVVVQLTDGTVHVGYLDQGEPVKNRKVYVMTASTIARMLNVAEAKGVPIR